jgi:tryptophan-rich sensory protein
MKKTISRVKRWVRRALTGCSVTGMLTGAGSLTLAGSIVRGVSGSPYQNGMMLRFGSLFPPVWLMGLMWMLWYALLGAALFCVLSDVRNDACTEAIKYRGGMSFLCMLFLGFLWYPVFFSTGRIFLSVLICASVLVLCVVTAWCYRVAFRLTAVLLTIHALFLLWLLILNIAALFCR